MAIKKATPQGSFNKYSKILHLLLLIVISLHKYHILRNRVATLKQ